MLTEKQTAFLKTWLDHQDWPVESEKGTKVDRDKVLFFLEQGIELRFQAPLDSDGEPLVVGVEYDIMGGEGGEILADREKVAQIDYEDQVIHSDNCNISFFCGTVFRKHSPEPETVITHGHEYTGIRVREIDGKLHRMAECRVCHVWQWIPLTIEKAEPEPPTYSDCDRDYWVHPPEPEPAKREKWRPEREQEYWTVNEVGRVFQDKWINHIIDRFRLALGLVFRTQEDADAKWKELGL